jgi:hypothetical protein
LTEAVAAAFRHTVSTYFNWQGSYSAIFLMCLQPAVFSERLYCLTPWLMSLSLFGGLFALWKSSETQMLSDPGLWNWVSTSTVRSDSCFSDQSGHGCHSSFEEELSVLPDGFRGFSVGLTISPSG